MSLDPQNTYTAFLDSRCLAWGAAREVALAVARARADDPHAMPLVFSDATGRQVELDPREGDSIAEAATEQPAKRGRPRLGVVAREVTLLPEHWDWLAAQSGGASVALRKLVHEARRAGAGRDAQRSAHERAYHVMSALAGNLAGFEEASRALFAGELPRLASLAEPWPADIRNHILRLADPAFDPGTGS